MGCKDGKRKKRFCFFFLSLQIPAAAIEKFGAMFGSLPLTDGMLSGAEGLFLFAFSVGFWI
jgi:hypothetical protein